MYIRDERISINEMCVRRGATFISFSWDDNEFIRRSTYWGTSEIFSSPFCERREMCVRTITRNYLRHFIRFVCHLSDINERNRKIYGAESNDNYFKEKFPSIMVGLGKGDVTGWSFSHQEKAFYFNELCGSFHLTFSRHFRGKTIWMNKQMGHILRDTSQI